MSGASNPAEDCVRALPAPKRIAGAGRGYDAMARDPRGGHPEIDLSAADASCFHIFALHGHQRYTTGELALTFTQYVGPLSRKRRLIAERLSVGSTKSSLPFVTRDRPCDFLISKAALSIDKGTYTGETRAQHGCDNGCHSAVIVCKNR
jgi:hypothetical protein